MRDSVKNVLNDEHAGFIVLILVSLAPLSGLGSGYDFLIHYRGAFEYGFGIDTWLPYWGYWILYPYSLLSPILGLTLWNLTNAIGLGLLAKKYHVNPFLLLFSFPVIYMLGNGQIEGVLAWGVLLSLIPNPILSGLGIIILCVKPQVTGILALWVFITRKDVRLLIVPLAVLILSFWIHGFWIDEWLISILNKGVDLNKVKWNITRIIPFPFTLIFLPFIYFHRKDPRAMLIFSAILMPYYAGYSLALPMSTVKLNWFNFCLIWVLSLLYIFMWWPTLAFVPFVLFFDRMKFVNFFQSRR